LDLCETWKFSKDDWSKWTWTDLQLYSSIFDQGPPLLQTFRINSRDLNKDRGVSTINVTIVDRERTSGVERVSWIIAVHLWVQV